MPTIHYSVLIASLGLIGAGIALVMTQTAHDMGVGLIGAGVGLLGPSAFGKTGAK